VNWEILLKYINKEGDALETLEVESWMHEQTEHAYLVSYLQKRKEQLQLPLKPADVDEQWQRLLNRMFETPSATGIPGKARLYRFMGIAASLLLLSIGSWMYLHSPTSSTGNQLFTLQTPANARGKVVLPDGTEVFMAPDSKIKYDNSFGTDKRIVQLSGEAFFNVVHQAHKPFIIYTENNLAVTVLGTSFNIYARSNHPATEVKVATGLVGVIENKHTHYLKAGQQLSYLLASHQVSSRQVAPNDAAALQKETLFFDNNNADEIAERLQRWYNLNVLVLPSARKHPRFSGEMKDTGIHHLMEGLRYATGINYRYKNPHTILLF